MAKEDWKNIIVLIAGGGRAGGRAAGVFLGKDIPVGLVDTDKKRVREARDTVSALLSRKVKDIFVAASDTEEVLQAAAEGEGLEFAVWIPETAERETPETLFVELEKSVPPQVMTAAADLFLESGKTVSSALHPERVVWLYVYPPEAFPSAAEYGPFEKTEETFLQRTAGLLDRAECASLRLKRVRPGGAGMLVQNALFLEAARQADEGFDVSAVEKAARLAFEIEEGFLSLMDRIGIVDTASLMDRFARNEGPLYEAYDNFFTVPSGIEKKRREEKDSSGPVTPFIDKDSFVREPEDFLMVDMLKKRFWGVVFMTASEVAGAGIADPKEMDAFFRSAFGWKEGPFTLMNRLTLEQSLRFVTERMELSHRKEINFPIPRNLIDRTSDNKPWPV